MNAILKFIIDNFGVKVSKFILKSFKRFYICLICGFISGVIIIGICTIVALTHRQYIKVKSIQAFNSIVEKQRNLVNNCKTQNCLGIGEVEDSGLRFVQIWCKNNATSTPYELTNIKGQWYSDEYAKPIGGDHDLYGVLHQLPTNDIVGIIPNIQKHNNRCIYNMRLLLRQNSNNLFLGNSEGFVEKQRNIPFFTELVFPNLNTKCNPNFQAHYAETNFKVIWITHYERRYFIWWSFAEEGKCNEMVTREDIFTAMRGLSNSLGNNYTKIKIKDLSQSALTLLHV